MFCLYFDLTVSLSIGEIDVTGTYKMTESGYGTAKVVKYFDTLFDSLNGGGQKGFNGIPGKPLTSAVTQASQHLPFWHKTILELKKMFFS